MLLSFKLHSLHMFGNVISNSPNTKVAISSDHFPKQPLPKLLPPSERRIMLHVHILPSNQRKHSLRSHNLVLWRIDCVDVASQSCYSSLPDLSFFDKARTPILSKPAWNADLNNSRFLMTRKQLLKVYKTANQGHRPYGSLESPNPKTWCS